MLTKLEIEKALPPNLKSSVTDALVLQVNNVVSDPVLAEQMRDNFISYSHVLRDGKYKMTDYLSAIQYVSYKLMNHSNQDAYYKTFPTRHANMQAQGMSQKDMSAYVSIYNKGKLVNAILEQCVIPSWVLNQDKFQEAINVQAELMNSAQSEMVRFSAANSLLTHLGKPKESNFQLNINATESSGMNEMRELLKQMATQQITLIEQGVPTKEIAGQRIFDSEVTSGTN